MLALRSKSPISFHGLVAQIILISARIADRFGQGLSDVPTIDTPCTFLPSHQNWLESHVLHLRLFLELFGSVQLPFLLLFEQPYASQMAQVPDASQMWTQ